MSGPRHHHLIVASCLALLAGCMSGVPDTPIERLLYFGTLPHRYYPLKIVRGRAEVPVPEVEINVRVPNPPNDSFLSWAIYGDEDSRLIKLNTTGSQGGAQIQAIPSNENLEFYVDGATVHLDMKNQKATYTPWSLGEMTPYAIPFVCDGRHLIIVLPDLEQENNAAAQSE